MAEVTKMRRLVNPGKKKRKLSALQKLFFGSKRQRAAAKANPSHRKAKKAYKKYATKRYARVFRAMPKRARRKTLSGMYKSTVRKRKRNVGSIVTVFPFGNPGRRRRRNAGKFSIRKTKKSLKKAFGYKFVSPFGRESGYRKRTRKRNRSSKKVVIFNKGAKMARRRVKRHRKNPVYRGRIKRGLYKYSSNPGRRRRRRTNRSYRRRRYNPGYVRRRRHVARRSHRRRNPGFLTGTAGSVVGVIGGVAVTKLLAGFLPSMFQSGVMNYLGIGAVAFAQGKLIGKVTRNPQLGHNMMIGGFAYLAAKVLSDFFPSLGGYTGISGMGLIGGSSFYTPQVNMAGNMGAFVTPASTVNAIGAATPVKAGMGTLRRTGRLM